MASALTSHAHGDLHLLGGFGEAQVDGLGVAGPAGHGTDQDGSRQSFAEQAEAGIDRSRSNSGNASCMKR